MKSVYKNIMLSVATGILGALAFPPADISLVAWVFLVPLLFVVKDTAVSLKGAFWYSFLSGIVLFSGVLYWLPNVTVPGTITLIFIMATYIGVFGVVAKIIFSNSMEPLILPFVWVVIEYLRGHLFTGFPWALLGYSQYTNINLIQVADMTGAYGISFIICAFNIGLFAVITKSNRKIACMMTVLFFILAASTYGISRAEQFTTYRKASVSVVQGNIPQEEKWAGATANSIIKTYSDLSREAAKDSPDMIVWPETSYPYLVDGKNSMPEEVSSLAKEINIPVLAGVVRSDKGLLYNTAMLFNRDGTLQGEYRKVHLVPFGEYVPFKVILDVLRNYIDKPIGDFARGKEFVLFPLKSISSSVAGDGAIWKSTNFYRFGVLICFEDIFPYVSREFVSRGASILFNITNDAWFGDTGAPLQHLQGSVFRAVENRVPVVRAANTGISAFIDPLGRITSMLEEEGKNVNVEGYLTSEVVMWPVRSFYTKYGDVFVYFCGLMMSILFLMEGVFRRKENS